MISRDERTRVVWSLNFANLQRWEQYWDERPHESKSSGASRSGSSLEHDVHVLKKCVVGEQDTNNGGVFAVRRGHGDRMRQPFQFPRWYINCTWEIKLLQELKKMRSSWMRSRSRTRK